MTEKKTEVLEGMKDVVAQGYTSAGNALHRIAGTEKGKQLDKEIEDKQHRGIDMVKMYDAMDRREAGKNATENMKRYGMNIVTGKQIGRAHV